MAELKKDGIRAAMSEHTERDTLKSMAQRGSDTKDEVTPHKYYGRTEEVGGKILWAIYEGDESEGYRDKKPVAYFVHHSDASAFITGSRASVATPRSYPCSCGGVLTAEEYITHYFELGHDRGAAAPIAYVCVTCGHSEVADEGRCKHVIVMSRVINGETWPEPMPIYCSCKCEVAVAPVAPVSTPDTLGHLRALLNRYAQPCLRDCDHSQCPLLRELHAIAMADTLERARQAVKPIVDREREGESVGDLMGMRLHAATTPPTATAEQNSLTRLLVATRRWRQARTAYMTDDSKTSREYGEAGDELALAITAFDAGPVTTTAGARECTEKCAAEIAFRINGGEHDDLSWPKPLCDLMDDPSIANEAALREWLKPIILKHFPFVQPVPSDDEVVASFAPTDEDEALDALRELFNMVNHALDSRDALLISKTCATMNKAREVLEKDV